MTTIAILMVSGSPACCVCGTEGGFIRPGASRPRRHRLEHLGGPPGVACDRCRGIVARGHRSSLFMARGGAGGEEPDHLARRAWMRARAARLICLAADLGMSWREVWSRLDLADTTRARRDAGRG